MNRENILLELGISISPDAIFYERENKDGFIFVSKEEDIVLKVFRESFAQERLLKEAKLLHSFKDSSFAPYVPKIKKSGKLNSGGFFLLTSYDEGSEVGKIKSKELYMLKNFYKILGNAMSEFYRLNNAKAISLKEWIEKAKLRVKSHPSSSHLQKGLDYLEVLQNDKLELISGLIHHDLHLGNLILTKESVKIIDWEGAFESLICVDMLDAYKRYVRKNKWENFLFKRFLKGARITKKLKEFMESFSSWQKEFFSLEVSNSDYKTYLVIQSIERSLIQYEMMRVDRMKDKKGFEFQVLKFIR